MADYSKHAIPAGTIFPKEPEVSKDQLEKDKAEIKELLEQLRDAPTITTSDEVGARQFIPEACNVEFPNRTSGNQFITTTPGIWPGSGPFDKWRNPEVNKKGTCKCCDGTGEAPMDELVITIFHKEKSPNEATRIFIGEHEIPNVVGVLVDNGGIEAGSIDLRVAKTKIVYADESKLEPVFQRNTAEGGKIFWGTATKEEAKQKVVEDARSDYARRLEDWKDVDH